MASVLPALVFLGYLLFKLLKCFDLRRRLRLAHDAELAVGQELNHLMSRGYQVYHDFPAPRFNIDHILVGPAGVFAVETKARTKRMTGNGKGDAEVIYDGQCLMFPGWVEKRPLDQAADQASWLRKWLSSAVGESVDVRAVVTLPGWCVKRSSPQGILVINPKNFRTFLTRSRNTTLSDSMIQRIAHQIEQRCRDVEPKAYPAEPRPM